MDAEKRKNRSGKGAKKWIITCAIFFAFYLMNVFCGKANIVYGLNLPHLGSVAEFLLLGLASILLIIAALHSEAAQKDTLTQNKPEVSK